MKLLVVGISGPSSSGKSTVVRSLMNILPCCTEIHLDDFYYPDAQIPIDEKHGVQNWDCAEALDWNKFKDYLQAVRSSDGDILPMRSLEIESELALTDSAKTKVRAKVAESYSWLEDCRVVLVDGFMLFNEPSVANLLDVKILFRAPHDTLKERRESRQGYNTVEGFWSDPPGYFDKIVWPAYVTSHKHLFDGGDVESTLTDEAINAGIMEINNDGSNDLPTLVSSAIECMARATTKEDSIKTL